MAVIRAARGFDIPDLPVLAALSENAPVYINSSGQIVVARANAIGTYAKGVINREVTSQNITDGGDAAKASIITVGVMDKVTVGGTLAIGADVYLDAAAAGAYTCDQPATAGNIIQAVGTVLSFSGTIATVAFNFLMNRPIALQAAGNSDCNIV